MFGFWKKRKIKQQMADWLTHQNEFGVRPKYLRYVSTFPTRLLGGIGDEVHWVRFTMPDGTKGLGFVNPPLTWAFGGQKVNSIDDGKQFIAYCGWARLFQLTQAGQVKTEFESDGELSRFLQKKFTDKFTNIVVQVSYKIGQLEIFEYSAAYEGKLFKGAGNSMYDVWFPLNSPELHLPTIYYYLGSQTIN